MRRKMRISWKAPLLAAIVVGVVAGAAGAKQTAVPGPADLGIRWRLNDGRFLNAYAYPSVNGKETGLFVGGGPGDGLDPMYYLGRAAIRRICSASQAACGWINKEHRLDIMESTGVAASVARARAPKPITYEIRWQVYDTCDCPDNADGYVDVGVKRYSQEVVFGTAPGDHVYGPESKAVALACENSTVICNILTKPHRLRGGPLP